MGGITTHEDNRRKLVEFIQDFPFRRAKLVTVKEDCVLGNHYHVKSDDVFYLLKGSGTAIIDSKEQSFKKGDLIHVPAGLRHILNMKKGSIILEMSTLPFDKADEIR